MIPSARAGSCQTCASYRLEIFALRHAVAHETRFAVAAQRPAEDGSQPSDQPSDQVPAQSARHDRSLQELARCAEEALARHLSERHVGSSVRQEAGAADRG